jgi:hypothetical protein
VLLGDTAWNAKMLVIVKPQDMKVTATFHQLAEKRFDRKNGMQELEPD